MSFNLKHYVVMAIGLVVLSAFLLHKPKSNQPVAFSNQGMLSSLTSTEALPGEIQPIQLELEVTPETSAPTQLEIPMVEPPAIDPQSAPIQDEWQLDFQESAEQTNFETSDLETSNSEVAEPALDTVDFSDLESGNQFVTESVEVLQDTSAAPQPAELDLVNTQPTQPSQQQTQPVAQPVETQQTLRHYQRPNSPWKRNPFIAQNTPPQAGQTEAVQPNDSDTIIVEPTVTEVTENSFKPQVNTPRQSFEGDFAVAQDAEVVPPAMPAKMDRSVLTQQNPAPERYASTADVPFASNDMVIPNLGTDSIAPLTITLPDTVAQQAVHHIEYGKSLARRGASQAAGQEFLSALKVIAQSNDVNANSNEFSVALAEAVWAMKEAKDFAAPNVQTQMITEVSRITGSHRTKIISTEQAKRTSPMMAMKKYFTFAQQKLDKAGGRNPVTAETLYCLGKLHTSMVANKSVTDKTDVAKAVTFHQAALMSDPNNYRSANELGVLLARQGQLGAAAGLFKQSLIANPTPQTWQNLAKTHRRLGEQDLAQLADTEFSMAAQNRMANASSSIQWLSSERFNASAPRDFMDNTRVARVPAPAPKAEPKPESKTENKTFGQVLKDLF